MQTAATQAADLRSTDGKRETTVFIRRNAEKFTGTKATSDKYCGKGVMEMKETYTGRISNSGSQIVKAPVKPVTNKGKGSVKKGDDLRGGK